MRHHCIKDSKIIKSSTTSKAQQKKENRRLRNTLLAIAIVVGLMLFFIIFNNPNLTPKQMEAWATPAPTATPEGYVDPDATPTPTPKTRPTPAPTPEPTPLPPVQETISASNHDTPVYEIPDYTATLIGWFKVGESIGVIDTNNGYARVIYGNKIGYCLMADFIEGAATLAPVAYNPDNDTSLMHNDPNYSGYVEYGYLAQSNPEGKDTELVDIRLIIPDAIIDLAFGTNNNPTGSVQYKKAIPMLQKETALKLKKAAQLFAQDGYTIKIIDAYRPHTVQHTLYNIVQNSTYVENPIMSASAHSRGAAVDIVLVDKNGNELTFPTEMYSFTSKAKRDKMSEWTDEERHNVEYMTRIMEQCGFKTMQGNWWHYADTDANQYAVLDIKVKKIPRYKKDAALKLIGNID